MKSADPIDRVLWGIAEAAGRYSPAAPEDAQRQAWAAIEEAVAEARRFYVGVGAELQGQLRAAMTARAEAEAGRAKAESERDEARHALEGAKGSRDVALATLQRAESQREQALAALAHAEAALSEIADQRDRALAQLHGRTRPDAPLVRMAALEPAPEQDEEDEIVLVDDEAGFTAEWRPEPTEPPPPSRTPLEGPVVYLQVGATFANLLPVNLGTLLVTDARVIRQEGRLAAVLALPSGPGGAPTAAAEAQADRLRDAGYRVEWSEDIHLAS